MVVSRTSRVKGELRSWNEWNVEPAVQRWRGYEEEFEKEGKRKEDGEGCLKESQ